jgi:hypothetical protein
VSMPSWAKSTCTYAPGLQSATGTAA